MEQPLDFSLGVNLRRYIYKILTGNDSEILLYVQLQAEGIKILRVIFRSKRSYSYSE